MIGMVKKSKGFRQSTRRKLRQKKRGRPGVTKYLQKLKTGAKVEIVLEPSSQRGMPYPRYKGKVGKVVGTRGKSYIVEIKDGGKTKKIISYPEHLRKAA